MFLFVFFSGVGRGFAVHLHLLLHFQKMFQAVFFVFDNEKYIDNEKYNYSRCCNAVLQVWQTGFPSLHFPWTVNLQRQESCICGRKTRASAVSWSGHSAPVFHAQTRLSVQFVEGVEWEFLRLHADKLHAVRLFNFCLTDFFCAARVARARVREASKKCKQTCSNWLRSKEAAELSKSFFVCGVFLLFPPSWHLVSTLQRAVTVKKHHHQQSLHTQINTLWSCVCVSSGSWRCEKAVGKMRNKSKEQNKMECKKNRMNLFTETETQNLSIKTLNWVGLAVTAGTSQARKQGLGFVSSRDSPKILLPWTSAIKTLCEWLVSEFCTPLVVWELTCVM